MCSLALENFISAIFYDIDGVMTDNTCWIDESGKEDAQINRSDGFSISLLKRQADIRQFIVTSEIGSPAVSRAKKLGLSLFSAWKTKGSMCQGNWKRNPCRF